LPFQSLGTFPRGEHLLPLFVQGTDKGKHLTVGQQDKINIPSCHEDAILSERISSFFNQAKINRHLTKLPKKLLRHNILAVLFRNRIDISEPNSETHVIGLPEERSLKICAILLERGTGDQQNVAKITDSQFKPATVSIE